MLTPAVHGTVIVKNFPNGFRGTSLLEIPKIEKTDNLVNCGAMSHMCIVATTRAAFDLGYNCIVAEDAWATKAQLFKGKTKQTSDIHRSFMAALSAPYAKVISKKISKAGHKSAC